MADLRKTTNTLEMGFGTVDGKTKYVSIPNPKTGVTASGVRTAMQYIVDNAVLLDTKDQSYTSVVTAYIENKVKTTLDLG